MATARQYAHLCKDQEKAQKIFSMIEEEYEKTVRYVLQVSECKQLLQHEELQKLSLERRGPVPRSSALYSGGTAQKKSSRKRQEH